MAYETGIANVEEYYANLLIIQYRNKPKARATIKLGADLYLSDGLVWDIGNVLDIDTAIGAQLDLIGKILGQSRNIPGLVIDKPFFSFEKEDAYGFSTADELSEGYWKNYRNSVGSVYNLSDYSYRILLKFKAMYNVRRASMAFMYDMYYRAFGNEIKMINNQDLTVTYEVSNNYSEAVAAALHLKLIEPCMGVDYSISYV